MKSEDAEHGNVLWMNSEGKGQAKMLRGEHVRALNMCAFSLSAFVFAFILFAAPISAHSTIHKAESTDSHQFTLEIYGNANEDDTIDMRDVTYIKLVIFRKKPETELCDANYDGRISMLDVVQTKLIIVGKEGELTFIDSYNKTVTVKKPINRIVVASPRAALAMLRSIGVEENRIVGVESLIQSSGGEYGVNHKIFFPEYQDKPTVGTVWHPDVEKILSLNPDCVFLIAMPGLRGATTVDDAADALKSAGIPVLRFWCGVYDRDVIREIRMLGFIFNKRERAEEFIRWREEFMNIIRERVEKISEEDKPKVYFETGFGAYYTGGEYITNIEFCGGKTIFPEVTESTQVDPEAVVERNPDVIIKVASPYATGPGVTGYDLDADDITKIKEVRDEIMNRPELKNVNAVKNGRVYVISSYIVGYGPADEGTGFLQKLYMAKWLHPELFKDLDPKAIHQEYLTRFQGLDIDLDEKGVFVYPEPS